MRLLLSLLLVLPAHAAAAVQQPWPVSTTYNSVDLQASVAFCVKVLGAVEVQPNISVPSNCDATMKWVQFPGSGYEFHFISTPSLATANFSFPDYVQYVEGLYGNLTEQTASTYDQFMDFHLGMIVDDMTPYYAALKQNNFPFFMVGQYPSFFDLFVEIPGTGHILELTSERLDDPNANISLWDICQEEEEQEQLKPSSSLTSPRSSTTSSPTSASSTSSPTSSSDFPQMNWRKTTFAAPYPAMAEAFTIKYLGAAYTKQSHIGVNLERCAKIAWSQLDYGGVPTPAGIPYQFHFVNGFKYPPYPPQMNIVDFAEFESAHRDFSPGDSWDEWANNRLTMWVDALEPFLDALQPTAAAPLFTPAAAEAVEAAAAKRAVEGKGTGRQLDWVAALDNFPTFPFITRRWDDSSLFAMIIDITPIAGHVIELVSDRFSDKYPTPKVWDFCNNNQEG